MRLLIVSIILKLAAAQYDIGYPLWYNQFGTAQGDEATSTLVDSSGNIYISGWTVGDLSGVSNGAEDCYIRKYSSDGFTLLWSIQFGTTTTDVCTSSSLGTSAVYIIGHTLGTLPGTTRNGSDGNFDVFVGSVSLSTGTLIWYKQYGTPDGADVSSGINFQSNNLYLTGNTNTSSWYGINAVGNGDIWTMKLNSAGSILWNKLVGTTQWDSVSGIVFISNRAVIVASTRGAYGASVNHGGSDLLMVTFSQSNGNSGQYDQWGTPLDDFGYGITGMSGDSIAIVGSQDTTLYGKDGVIFVMTISNPALSIITRNYTTASDDELRSVKYDPNNDFLYAFGTTTGTFTSKPNAGTNTRDIVIFSMNAQGEAQYIERRTRCIYVNI